MENFEAIDIPKFRRKKCIRKDTRNFNFKGDTNILNILIELGETQNSKEKLRFSVLRTFDKEEFFFRSRTKAYSKR